MLSDSKNNVKPLFFDHTQKLGHNQLHTHTHIHARAGVRARAYTRTHNHTHTHSHMRMRTLNEYAVNA